MIYNEIDGDLITLANAGAFDVITHGCNCFCTMGAGIAVRMNLNFLCNDPTFYKLEHPKHSGNVNKLGCIEDRIFPIAMEDGTTQDLVVINSYTQYYYGQKGYQSWRYRIPFDYDAFTLCMRKINFKYPGKHIGMPTIGANLAGGEWSKILGIIKVELKDMEVTIVKFNK